MSSDLRSIVWSFDLGEGHEHLSVSLRANGIDADGAVIHLMPGKKVIRHRYILGADGNARTRTLMLDPLDGRAALVLVADGEGRWFDATGRTIAHLDGCIDLDIAGSCFTNTLSIRRLQLREGESADIRVAYVDLPELTVRAVHQRYARRADTTYGYEGLDSRFKAEIEVDADGLVIRYAGRAHRV
jgi:uncharacterized protein